MLSRVQGVDTIGTEDDRGARGSRVNKILKDGAVKIGEKKFFAPASVKRYPVAEKKWREIMELYATSTISITTEADIGLLERYCLAYKEYKDLQATIEQIDERCKDDLIAATKMKFALKLETQIDKKNSLLMRMEEQLFLTPLSKCRAIPRGNGKHKPDKLKEKGFDNV